MYSFTIPANKKKLTVIKIGGYHSSYKVLSSDMELIRDMVINENLSIEETKKLLLVTSVEEFPEISSNDDYLFLINSDYNLTFQDKLHWIDALEDAKDNEDIKIFMLDALDLKRIKKYLLPFI